MEVIMLDNETSAVAQTGQSVETPVQNPEVSTTGPVGQTNETKQELSKPEGDWVKYDNYRKQLNEKSRWRDRAEQAEVKLTELENAKLVETNNYKALYENEKQARAEAEAKTQELEGIVTNGVKFSAVKSLLESNGVRCHNYDALFTLGQTELLQSTEDGNVEGVEQFINSARENHAYLFQKNEIPKTTTMPPTYQPTQVTSSSFADLPKDQQQQILNNISS